jgi:HlyD family secretion protein
MDVLIPKKKWWFVARWWWLGMLVLAGLGAAGFYWPRQGQRLHVAASRLTISPVTRGNFQEFTAIDGVVQPLHTVYLDAAEAGTVQQVLVEEGATLTAGQPLLRLTNPDLQLEMVNRETAVYDLMNNLRNTRNQLLQNRILRQNQLADIDFQLAEARRVFDTNQVLYAQKVIARQDYLQSQNAYRYQLRRRQLTQQTLRQDSVAMLQQLSTMQESVQRMTSNLALMRRKMADLLLRAPVGGRLSSLAAEVGEAKTRGQRLGQIDGLAGVKLHAAVDEFYIARIAAGQVGEVVVDGQAYPLRVTKIFAQVAKGLQIDLAFTGTPAPGPAAGPDPTHPTGTECKGPGGAAAQRRLLPANCGQLGVQAVCRWHPGPASSHPARAAKPRLLRSAGGPATRRPSGDFQLRRLRRPTATGPGQPSALEFSITICP